MQKARVSWGHTSCSVVCYARGAQTRTRLDSRLRREHPSEAPLRTPLALKRNAQGEGRTKGKAPPEVSIWGQLVNRSEWYIEKDKAGFPPSREGRIKARTKAGFPICDTLLNRPGRYIRLNLTDP